MRQRELHTSHVRIPLGTKTEGICHLVLVRLSLPSPFLSPPFPFSALPLPLTDRKCGSELPLRVYGEALAAKHFSGHIGAYMVARCSTFRHPGKGQN